MSSVALARPNILFLCCDRPAAALLEATLTFGHGRRNQLEKYRDNVISSLNMAIEVLNLAKEVSSIMPAEAVFGSISTLLVLIKVRSPLLWVAEFPPHRCPGFNGQPRGLRYSWADLC